MADYILEMSNITKIFPGVKALDGVRFNLKKGEIHALMGENGAGKSTFIKVLTGVHQPDGGTITLNGEKIVMHDPLVAQRHGIAAIYQHLAAYPHLTVAENIFMGHEKLGKLRNIQWKKANDEAKRLLESLGSSISPTDRMGVLSVAQQQLVEIAKALSQNMQILIMDEPTAALSRRESEELYAIAARLREQGVSIILISHRFEDMYRLADRVTVLRDAQYIGTWPVNEVSSGDLVRHMVGRSIDQFFPQKTSPIGKELLRAEKLSRTGFFADVSFALHAGEILCLTGLVGAGRTEVVEAICGVTRPSAGEIFIEGKKTDIESPHAALRMGIGLLPEDRQKQGLILKWSVGRNITLPSVSRFAKKGLVAQKRERAEGDRYKDLLKIRATSIDEAADALSGGNQQKVVVGKLLSGNSRILILDEPTKGVDVGSKAQMYEIMCDLTDKGYGILLVSSELPEVVNMADNIVVMREGRVSTIIPREEATQENVLKAGMPLEKRA
jgi:rhamnose transport system ATP-binding protein